MGKTKVVAAIDIGTEKVCTLIAVVEEGGELRVVGASAVRSAGIRKSQIVNLEEAAAAVTESVDAAERMAGFSINHAYVSVGGKHIESQNSKGVVAVTDPNGDITHADVERVIEAARAIQLPANREVLHVLPTAYQVDSQEGIKDPVGMSGVRLEAETHIVTGSSTVLKNIRKIIEQLGVQVAEFVFAGVASSLAVLSETERELGVVVVDIGAGSTSLCVFVEGSLVHSAVIPVGATHITKDIALGSRVSIPAAEAIKKALTQFLHESTPDRYPDESREDARKRKKNEDQLDLQRLGLAEETRYLSRKTLIDGIIAPRLREIFELVEKELRDHNLMANVPAGLVLTGGGAETAGMADVAKKVLGLPARVGRPVGLRGLIDEIETPPYATCTGLLLFGKQSQRVVAHESGGGSKLSALMDRPGKLKEVFLRLLKSVMP